MACSSMNCLRAEWVSCWERCVGNSRVAEGTRRGGVTRGGGKEESGSSNSPGSRTAQG